MYFLSRTKPKGNSNDNWYKPTNKEWFQYEQMRCFRKENDDIINRLFSALWERAKWATPAASLSQWKAPFSTALITASAALLGSDRLVSMQPSKSSLTSLLSSATESSDPQSASMPLLIDPQSVTVKEGELLWKPLCNPTPNPFTPFSQVPGFQWSSISVAGSIDCQSPQWHYRSVRPLVRRVVLCPRPTLQPGCGILIALRYSIEVSLLIIHLLCCNFIFFPVHAVVTGNPDAWNLVNSHTAFCVHVTLSCSCICFYTVIPILLSICTWWEHKNCIYQPRE